MNRSQRVVIVVALAGALHAFRNWLLTRDVGGDWFNYAPVDDGGLVTFSGMGWTKDGVLVLTIVLTAVWSAVSLWLLRDRRAPRPVEPVS